MSVPPGYGRPARVQLAVLADRGHRIGNPGAGYQQTDPRLSGHPGVPICHKARTLLVAGHDEVQPVVVERTEKLDRVDARDAEH